MADKPKNATDPMQHRERHDRFHRFAMRYLFRFFRRRFNLEAIPAPDIDGPFLLLANHNLDLDPVLIHLSFKKLLYFVSSDHVLRKGSIGGWFLNRYFAPIPRLKGSTDIGTVKGVLRRLKHGVGVCIFAEGNRSFTGVTGHIPISIAKLAKICKVPVLTYRFEGGYFTSPRWSTSLRRGKMKGYVVSMLEPETVAAMSVDELYEQIKRDLHEDAYTRQVEVQAEFKGKRMAEALESTLYYCPSCRSFGTLRSADDTLRCTCGLDAAFDVFGNLNHAPFRTIVEWDQVQREALAMRIQTSDGEAVFSDDGVTLKEVTRDHKITTLLRNVRLTLFSDRIECGALRFDIGNIQDMANVGRNRILFTSADRHYEWSGARTFCGRKYVEAYGLIKDGE